MLNVEFKRSPPLLMDVSTCKYDTLLVASKQEMLIEIPSVRDLYLCCSRNRCHLVMTLLVIICIITVVYYVQMQMLPFAIISRCSCDLVTMLFALSSLYTDISRSSCH